MTTVKRPSLKLRREALLALADVVGCAEETKQAIIDAPHSMIDVYEVAIARAIVEIVKGRQA